MKNLKSLLWKKKDKIENVWVSGHLGYYLNLYSFSYPLWTLFVIGLEGIPQK